MTREWQTCCSLGKAQLSCRSASGAAYYDAWDGLSRRLDDVRARMKGESHSRNDLARASVRVHRIVLALPGRSFCALVGFFVAVGAPELFDEVLVKQRAATLELGN
jgi:hypothetical protein